MRDLELRPGLDRPLEAVAQQVVDVVNEFHLWQRLMLPIFVALEHNCMSMCAALVRSLARLLIRLQVLR